MIKTTSFKLLTLGVACIGLMATTGCDTNKRANLLEKDGHYWQRVETSSAIYLRGPKAQQRLNMHIANCVSSVKELERLGAITKAVPGKEKNSVAESDLSEFETPNRVGFLLREHLDYHDFESCMYSKGWERVEFVPYDVADDSLTTYKRTHATFQRTYPPTPDELGDFDDLND